MLFSLRIRPPFVAGALLAAAWLWQRRLGALRYIVPPYNLAGWLCLAAGGMLGLVSLYYFRRHDTTHHPFGEPRAMVTSGPYRFTRNPMYLATPVLFALIVNAFHVPGEERRLARLFGGQFADYKRRVRRWL